MQIADVQMYNIKCKHVYGMLSAKLCDPTLLR